MIKARSDSPIAALNALVSPAAATISGEGVSLRRHVLRRSGARRSSVACGNRKA
jgi:hypothetical protein